MFENIGILNLISQIFNYGKRDYKGLSLKRIIKG